MNNEERDVYYQLHNNINARQFDKDMNKLREFETWLYEAKRAAEERKRLPIWFKKLRENDLPKIHQQCSQSAPVEIKENKLTCCLGQNVAECSILKDVFKDTEKFSPELIDQWKADICIGHILQECAKRHVDTSEGYIQDESDRIYWQNVYSSMAEPV